MSFGQSVNGHAPVKGYTIPVFAWISTESSTPDTLGWYLNRAEVATTINDSLLANAYSWATASSVNAVSTRIPINVYTYSVSPLNHISAAPYSICVTADTSIYVKVGTLSDSARWFKAR